MKAVLHILFLAWLLLVGGVSLSFAQQAAQEAESQRTTSFQRHFGSKNQAPSNDPADEGKFRQQRRRFIIGALLASAATVGSYLLILQTLGSITSLFALMLFSICLGITFLFLHLILIRSFQIWRIRRRSLRKRKDP